MGLIQREIERRGISTVSVTLHRGLTEKVRPPRALYVRWPAGHPFGAPGNLDQQRTVLRQALRALVTMTEPGTILDLPYVWGDQDYSGLPATIRLGSSSQ